MRAANAAISEPLRIDAGLISGVKGTSPEVRRIQGNSLRRTAAQSTTERRPVMMRIYRRRRFDRQRGKIAGAKLAVLECPHIAAIEKPGETTAALRDWLAN